MHNKGTPRVGAKIWLPTVIISCPVLGRAMGDGTFDLHEQSCLAYCINRRNYLFCIKSCPCALQENLCFTTARLGHTPLPQLMPWPLP